MSTKLTAIRGMNDILPEQMQYWHWLEEQLRKLAKRYGYQEIRTPIVEKTELFARSIGEVTDIVEKEMYTFLDRNQDSLSLRPEGTASCVRAAIEHGLLHNQTQRLWYFGPLFRHERPQKGRYRQFYQFGVEALGFPGADIEAEMIFITAAILRALGLENSVTLQINSLGTAESRAAHRSALVAYFTQHKDQLDEDSVRRLQSNPLRILDSKNPALKELIASAPMLTDFLSTEAETHFALLRQLLTDAGIPYVVNPLLVRGLDYYTGMVFEWVTEQLGAQGTVCAGGRYDNLIAELGGPATPAVGFAMGCERIIELLQMLHPDQIPAQTTDAYCIMVGEQAERIGLVLVEQLRQALPNLCIISNCGGGNFKSQFKRADKSGAAIALILGEDELRENKIAIKFLREQQEQLSLSRSDVISYLSEWLNRRHV